MSNLKVKLVIFGVLVLGVGIFLSKTSIELFAPSDAGIPMIFEILVTVPILLCLVSGIVGDLKKDGSSLSQRMFKWNKKTIWNGIRCFLQICLVIWLGRTMLGWFFPESSGFQLPKISESWRIPVAIVLIGIIFVSDLRRDK